jgi:undecaprenyl-diphosphatase
VSVASGTGGRTAVRLSRLRQFAANARGTTATLFRAPRPAGRRAARPSSRVLALGAIAAVAAIVATMVVVDPWALAQVRRLPTWLVVIFDRITDLGLSGWFLWPIGLTLIGLAILDAPPLTTVSRRVLASLAVRLGFVFAALAVPGLFLTIAKRLIGRLRPRAAGGDVFAYAPLHFGSAYHSMPSGHAATVASVAVAIGILCPRLRALMWCYALVIWVSRVVVSAHYPSDVLAGALIGAFGALLVRNWFAERRLGFVVAPDGSVRTLPGPPWRRIKGVARRLLSA